MGVERSPRTSPCIVCEPVGPRGRRPTPAQSLPQPGPPDSDPSASSAPVPPGPCPLPCSCAHARAARAAGALLPSRLLSSSARCAIPASKAPPCWHECQPAWSPSGVKGRPQAERDPERSGGSQRPLTPTEATVSTRGARYDGHRRAGESLKNQRGVPPLPGAQVAGPTSGFSRRGGPWRGPTLPPRATATTWIDRRSTQGSGSPGSD